MRQWNAKHPEIEGKPAGDQASSPHSSAAIGEIYHIRVKGHLDSHWSQWFEGLTITEEGDGTSLLAGAVADQAALHGLLVKIRNMGLPLVSVNRVQPDQQEDLAQSI